MPAKQTPPPTDRQRRSIYLKALEYLLCNLEACRGHITPDPYPTGLCPLIGIKILKKDEYTEDIEGYNNAIAPYTNPLKKYSPHLEEILSKNVFWFEDRQQRIEALQKEIELLSKS